MIICHPCKAVMICDQTGSSYHFGNGHTYAADTYRCIWCGQQTAVTAANAGQVPLEGRKGDTWHEMKEGE